MKEEYFNVKDNKLFLLLNILEDGKHPVTYIIPATAWDKSSQTVFVHRTYEGKKSKPEYGLNISAKNMLCLEKYKLENVIGNEIG